MTNKKRVMFVFGTRPEAIKMAPVITAVEKYCDKLQPLVVVTGQHRQMLDQVLNIFKITPHHDLEIMQDKQTLVDIISRCLRRLEGIVAQEKPDMLLVQGDTSTAFATGLIAYYNKIPLGHIEAGLRTFDKWRPFPEEINRKLLTSLADLHFAPTQTSVNNLLEENVLRDAICLTGNTVIDALFDVSARKFDLTKIGLCLNPERKLVLATIHRRESFGDQMQNVCRAIARLAQRFPDEIELVLPVHKNPNVKDLVYNMLSDIENVRLIESLEYEPFVHLMKSSYIILTDSGGIQEEGPSLGKPVLVLREKTERPEAIAAGTVKLVGMDEDVVFCEAEKLLANQAEYRRMSNAINPYGDGKAADRIVQSLLCYFGLSKNGPVEFSV